MPDIGVLAQPTTRNRAKSEAVAAIQCVRLWLCPRSLVIDNLPWPAVTLPATSVPEHLVPPAKILSGCVRRSEERHLYGLPCIKTADLASAVRELKRAWFTPIHLIFACPIRVQRCWGRRGARQDFHIILR